MLGRVIIIIIIMGFTPVSPHKGTSVAAFRRTVVRSDVYNLTTHTINETPHQGRNKDKKK